MGLFPPRIPVTCQHSRRELVPGVHVFRDFTEMSATSRSHIVESARAFQHLAMQGDERSSSSVQDGRFDIDAMCDWPARRWCFVREGLRSASGVSRIVASGTMLSRLTDKLELCLLHYDHERPESGVQVLEALFNEYEQDPSLRAFTTVNDVGGHTSIRIGVIVRAASTHDVAVSRFVRANGFRKAKDSDRIEQDTTKPITFILRGASSSRTPARAVTFRPSLVDDTKLVEDPTEYEPVSIEMVPPAGDSDETTQFGSPRKPNPAPTPHCTPAVISQQQKQALQADALCSALNSLRPKPHIKKRLKDATQSENGTGDIVRCPPSPTKRTPKRIFKKRSAAIVPPLSPPFCVPQHMTACAAASRHIPHPVASLSKLARYSPNKKERAAEGGGVTPAPTPMSTPARGDIWSSPRRRCSEARSPSLATHLGRFPADDESSPMIPAITPLRPLSERNVRFGVDIDKESTDREDLLKRMERLNQSLLDASRRAEELDFENMVTRAEIPNDEVSRIQDKSWQSITRHCSLPAPKIGDLETKGTGTTATSYGVDSLACNPLGMHEVLHTLSTLSDEVVQLKKGRRPRIFLPETPDKDHCEKEESPEISGDMSAKECTEIAVQTNDIDLPRQKSLDEVLERNPRHTERINSLASKLHKQFGFPFEAIIHAATRGDSSAIALDEFDVIQALFSRYFLAEQKTVVKSGQAEVDVVSMRIDEGTALRSQGATYDKCNQVWSIPISMKQPREAETSLQESCTLHCFVAPPHHGASSPTSSDPETYPLAVPPLYVESDCGRFEGSDAADVIRQLVNEASKLISSKPGAPFLQELTACAATVIARCPFSETRVIPRPLQSHIDASGFQRGVISALSAMPELLGDFFARSQAGSEVTFADLSQTLFGVITDEPEIATTKVEQPMRLVLDSLVKHEADRHHEISQLELRASDLRGQIHVLQQLRTTQSQIQTTSLSGLLWKRVGSRVGKGHTRRFTLRDAVLSWAPPPGSVHASSRSFMKQLTHSKGAQSSQSSTKTFKLDATTVVDFIPTRRPQPQANKENLLQTPAKSKKKLLSKPFSKSNTRKAPNSTSSANQAAGAGEPAVATTTPSKNAMMLSPSVNKGANFATPATPVARTGRINKLSPRKAAAPSSIGKRRSSFSRTSQASTSMWSALSTQTLLRSGAEKLSSKTPDHAFFVRSHDRELVLHGDTPKESAQWISTLQAVVILLQEAERLGSQLDEIPE